MVSFGSEKGSSSLQSMQLPGIFGAGGDRKLGLDIKNLIGQDVGFGGRTRDENQLISELIDLAGANTAVRGLGAPTAESIASSIAPTLLDFRNQRVNERNTQAGLLLELLGFASPQTIAGQQSTQRGFNAGISYSGGGGS